MKKIINIVFIMCLAQFLFGQIKIVGNVVSESKEELIYDVILYQKDSSVVFGNTFFTSKFDLEASKLEKGYYLEITAFGCAPKRINLTQETSFIDIGEVVISKKSYLLGEVTVVSRRKFVENNNGNLKFNINGSSLENAGQGFDVLRKLPGVIINDNKVNILGRGVPLIIIDERESTQQELANLPSDQIASIEIIKTTSAEYSASANTVVKVTTLNQKYNGWNVKVTNQITKATFFRYYGGIDLGYKKNKASYFLHFNTNPSQIRYKETYFRNFNDINYTIDNSIIRDVYTPQYYTLNFNTHQQITKRSSLYFQTQNNFNKNIDTTNNVNFVKSIYNNQNIITKIVTPSETLNHSDNLTFTHKLDSTGKEFKLLVNYAYFKENNVQNIDEKIDMSSVRESAATFKNIANTLSLNPKFILPLSSSLKISTGARYAYINNNSIYNYTNKVENTINEHVFAAYIQANKELNKFSLQLGLRYEFATSKAVQNNTTNLFDRKFSNLFPNASIQYTLNKDFKTHLSYAYKINRANLYDVTSYNIFVDRYSGFSGNPSLLPEFSHVIDYSFSYKDAASLNFSYINTQNPIFYYINYQGLNTNALQSNFDYSDKYTISLNLPYQKGAWTIFNSLGYVIQKNVFAEKGLDIKNQMFYFAIYNEFNLKKILRFDVLYQYNSTGLMGLLAFEPRHVFSINASKKIWNDKVELYAQFNDIFNNDIYNLSAQVQQLQVKNYRFSDQQRFRLGVIFRLNNFNNINKYNSVNEDEKRIKREK